MSKWSTSSRVPSLSYNATAGASGGSAWTKITQAPRSSAIGFNASISAVATLTPIFFPHREIVDVDLAALGFELHQLIGCQRADHLAIRKGDECNEPVVTEQPFQMLRTGWRAVIAFLAKDIRE